MVEYKNVTVTYRYKETGDTAVARALIGGGGGCLFIYSCSARLVSFEIKFKSINLKRN